MKQYTTPEQTAKLIELGFEKPNEICLTYFDSPNDFKSTNVIEIDEYGYEAVLENYSIGELIEMLPNVVESEDGEYATLQMFFDLFNWIIEYIGVNKAEYATSAIELIDALYDMVLRLKEEGVI